MLNTLYSETHVRPQHVLIEIDSNTVFMHLSLTSLSIERSQEQMYCYAQLDPPFTFHISTSMGAIIPMIPMNCLWNCDQEDRY